MLCWSKKERISPRDLVFIADRMSLVQIRNYLERQKRYFDDSCRQALTTWQDYLAMAERLHYDTSDEIVYRVRKLRQRQDVYKRQKVFRVNDRIMQTKNTAKVSNGDLGFIRYIKDDENGKRVGLD